METKDNCIKCGTHRNELNEVPWCHRFDHSNPENNRIICKPCRRKEDNEQIEKFQASETDLEFTDDIICPFCGEKHESDGESIAFYAEGCHDFDCGNCHQTFVVETTVSISYTTKPSEQHGI